LVEAAGAFAFGFGGGAAFLGAGAGAGAGTGAGEEVESAASSPIPAEAEAEGGAKAGAGRARIGFCLKCLAYAAVYALSYAARFEGARVAPTIPTRGQVTPLSDSFLGRGDDFVTGILICEIAYAHQKPAIAASWVITHALFLVGLTSIGIGCYVAELSELGPLQDPLWCALVNNFLQCGVGAWIPYTYYTYYAHYAYYVSAALTHCPYYRTPLIYIGAWIVAGVFGTRTWVHLLVENRLFVGCGCASLSLLFFHAIVNSKLCVPMHSHGSTSVAAFYEQLAKCFALVALTTALSYNYLEASPAHLPRAMPETLPEALSEGCTRKPKAD
jgi:hypothetical protein